MTNVCLVTTGHLSTNPRLVKEADALHEAGYAVRVVACEFMPWARAADAAFHDRPWPVELVRFGALADGVAGRWTRLRYHAARAAAARVGPTRAPDVLLERAAHYVTPDLRRAAASAPADVFIAHNLGALPAAASAARHWRARLGFDAEDFHRGELAITPATAPQRALVGAIEQRYMPYCHYVTAASDGIADAYVRAIGIPRPTTVLNVFPHADLHAAVEPASLANEVPRGARSLHWFSQTIGPGRGLEDAVRALARLPPDVLLSLRGGWAEGYQDQLRGLAEALGVGRRVRVLAHCPPNEVVRRAAEHDVGLALEVGLTVNRDVCVTNKIFTYLLAGLPVAASATTGQRAICAEIPRATQLYDPGDAEGLARAATSLLGAEARAAAEAARGRYVWDAEKHIVLNLVGDVVARPLPRRERQPAAAK